MKSYFKIFGLAFGITLAPIAGFAQSLGQTDSNSDGTLAAPDGNTSDINANPFTGAAGADKFYQNNSLTGAAQPNNAAPSGNATSMNAPAPAPTLAPADSDSTGLSANPFAGAAGADKFYQDNSLTGSVAQPSNAGILGGGLGSSAQSWATTP